MTTKLRRVIEKAIKDLDTYKHPDLEECEKAIYDILEAADLRVNQYRDEITYLEITDGNVCVGTSYNVRGCDGFDSFSFPVSIIDSDDPIKAASLYGLEEKIALVEYDIASHHTKLEYINKRIAQLQSDLINYKEEYVAAGGNNGKV